MEPFFIIVVLAILAVVIVLMLGLSGLARGKGWTHSKSNTLMRWRIILQALAVLAILILVYLRKSGG